MMRQCIYYTVTHRYVMLVGDLYVYIYIYARMIYIYIHIDRIR